MQISAVRVTALLNERYLKPSANRATDNDKQFASKLITILDKCTNDRRFSESVFQLFSELDDSDYFYFDEFDDHEDLYNINLDPAKEDDDWFDSVALTDTPTANSQLTPQLHDGVLFHGVLFPIDQAEQALTFYRDGPKQPGKSHGSRTLDVMMHNFYAMFKNKHDLDAYVFNFMKIFNPLF
jgi:hypothetical protein